ncbi:alpha/beta hydrolase [Alkalihalobacillus sp. TS-13]|uniref:alpha/beta hydrolase n=1 Tax=Alkalihalobacillus sp. TS-13 TaxID=2842455 RepID=UPI001C86CCF7|nr:alpha/beta fold hydrolase [Alkalihalobacillus sp. TS-13]
MKQGYLTISRKRSVVLFFLFVLTIAYLSSGRTTAATDEVQCQKTTSPVTLSAADPTEYEVVGWLCYRGTLKGKTIQVLVSGITYDHHYWDFPFKPQNYSYVQHATDAGYVTFNIDRIGVGQSDRPPADQVTVQSGAHVVHQIVQKLREGNVADTRFSNIILTGHSFGSSMSLYEASTYQDVDGLILSGMMHEVTTKGYSLLSNLYPGQSDPKFLDAYLPAGYFTTQPDTRGDMFYHQADGDVISLDEELKQTVTSGELNSLTDAHTEAISKKIKVPVLIAIGDKDIIFCEEEGKLSCADRQTVLKRESPYYSPDVPLEAFVLTGTGHNLNLHPDAEKWFSFAGDWGHKYVGNTTSTKE